MPIEPPMSEAADCAWPLHRRRSGQRAPAAASRRRRSGSSPASARCAARRRRSARSRSALPRADRPTRPRRADRCAGKCELRASWPIGHGAASVVSPAPAAASTAPRRGMRFARDFDRQARRPRSLRGRRAGADIRCPPASTRSACGRRPLSSLASSDRVPAGTMPSSQDPRFDDLAVLDQRGAGLADPALDQPFRQSDSPRSSAAPASRRAAGRRRWNSCRRCAGHRPRHSPGAHSRRPCRAIRRGSA